jgi:hypothetical protein
MWNLEMLEAFSRTSPPLFELHQQGSLALKDACLRFAALFDPAALPPPDAPAPDTAPPRLRDQVGLQHAVWLTVQRLEPCTNAQVNAALGEQRQVTHQALQALVKHGKVVKAGATYRVVAAARGSAA